MHIDILTRVKLAAKLLVLFAQIILVHLLALVCRCKRCVFMRDVRVRVSKRARKRDGVCHREREHGREI